MKTTGKVLRSVSLAVLSGGSAAIVFSAIVLVKAATAKGIPVAEAAAVNAPIFIHYAKVALGASILLGLSELIDFQSNTQKSKLDTARYLSSFLCIISMLVYALAIVPPMAALLPDIKTVAAAHQQFQHLHEVSRAVFGAGILFAFISVLLPCFKKDTEIKNLTSESKDLDRALSK
ncbi:MAG: DUF4149 domain-containing protein [Candidatus Obscuribacterales bacterium]|nr:DUF4149 domain-containing protein [Candidatus Obscuribacterales bacterium]